MNCDTIRSALRRLNTSDDKLSAIRMYLEAGIRIKSSEIRDIFRHCDSDEDNLKALEIFREFKNDCFEKDAADMLRHFKHDNNKVKLIATFGNFQSGSAMSDCLRQFSDDREKINALKYFDGKIDHSFMDDIKRKFNNESMVLEATKLLLTKTQVQKRNLDKTSSDSSNIISIPETPKIEEKTETFSTPFGEIERITNKEGKITEHFSDFNAYDYYKKYIYPKIKAQEQKKNEAISMVNSSIVTDGEFNLRSDNERSNITITSKENTEINPQISGNIFSPFPGVTVEGDKIIIHGVSFIIIPGKQVIFKGVKVSRNVNGECTYSWV